MFKTFFMIILLLYIHFLYEIVRIEFLRIVAIMHDMFRFFAFIAVKDVDLFFS
jgi:23S rRNA maturation-related 3'-5' exoribonuclease YhaM